MLSRSRQSGGRGLEVEVPDDQRDEHAQLHFAEFATCEPIISTAVRPANETRFRSIVFTKTAPGSCAECEIWTRPWIEALTSVPVLR